MAVDLVLTGHGGFNPADGSIRVPEGSTIKFYADACKALLNSNGVLVDKFSDVLAQVQPTVYEAGDTCWDYTISPPDGLDIYRQADDPNADPSYQQWIASGTYKLSQILASSDFQNRTLHWGACVVVELQEVGGAYVGVNAGQRSLAGGYEEGTDPSQGREWDGDLDDVRGLLGRAFPGTVPDDRVRNVVRQLATKRAEGTEQLLEAWRTLPEPDRNGLWLNDTLKWWLEAIGVPENLDSDSPEIGFLRWDQIEWEVVTGFNQQTLKDLEEGDSVPFWQARGGLLLGWAHPANYRQIFEEAAGNPEGDGSQPHGTVTMTSKGGVMSRGTITVSGMYDAGSFESSIAEFSKKEIEFS